ncbi:MAG: MFS transporter [Flavobacteriales bacterium]
MKKPNRNISRLGIVSLFTDWASEMSFPLLPLFLTNYLKATKTEVGFIEGLAELTASLLKVLSGALSDRSGKRKPWAVAGYGLSALAKPLLALTAGWGHVLGIRIADRFGKGIRTSPRDALIAGYSNKKVSGKSFGLHRGLDNLGAILGTLCAFMLLKWLGESEHSFRLIFALAIIPGVLAVVVLVFAVREPPGTQAPGKAKLFAVKGFAPGYFRFLIIQAIFSAVAMNYAFMILKAEHVGIKIGYIPLAYLLYNMVYFVFSYPAGLLADRIGKVPVMSATYLAFACGVLCFTLANPWAGWIAFALYGLYMAGFQTVSRAMISDMIPQGKSGLAFGVYHTAIGLASFLSLALAGYLWDSLGANSPFYLAATVATLLAFALPMLLRSGRKS